MTLYNRLVLVPNHDYVVVPRIVTINFNRVLTFLYYGKAPIKIIKPWLESSVRGLLSDLAFCIKFLLSLI